MQLVVIQ